MQKLQVMAECGLTVSLVCLHGRSNARAYRGSGPGARQREQAHEVGWKKYIFHRKNKIMLNFCVVFSCREEIEVG